MQPAGEILFREPFLPDICSHPLWRNDLRFPEALLFDKAAKAVQFMLRQLYIRSEREKGNLLAAPNQSQIILVDLDCPIQRPKVAEVRRVRKLRPSVGVPVRKMPHTLLRRTATVPGPVEMMIGMLQADEKAPFISL